MSEIRHKVFISHHKSDMTSIGMYIQHSRNLISKSNFSLDTSENF